MIAAGKKNRLKMKYPMKLWPFRPATRAGQNAIAIQMTANKIHQMTDMAVSFPRSYRTLVPAAGRQPRHVDDVAAPGRCPHHPGITPEGVICGDRDVGPMSAVFAWLARASSSFDLHRGDASPWGSSCLASSA
jgi:hypothetical protein